MEADTIKIILVSLFVLGIGIYFSRQPKFETILLVVAIAGIIFAFTQMGKDKIVMEGE